MKKQQGAERGAEICEEEYNSLQQMSFSNLDNLPAIHEKQVDGYTIAIWKESVGLEVRIVVQAFKSAKGFFGWTGLGWMTYRGFRKSPDGVVTAIPQEDLFEFSEQ